MLLVSSQPRFLTISQNTPSQEIRNESQNYKNESNGVQVVNSIMENLDADNHTPEVASQKRNVEECRRCHSQNDRGERIEERED